MIVTEYMSHGALDGFLRVSGLGPGDTNDHVTLGPPLFSMVGLGIGFVPDPMVRLTSGHRVRRRLPRDNRAAFLKFTEDECTALASASYSLHPTAS